MQVEGEHQAVDDPTLLPQDLLRKYITYAKKFCRPKLQNADYDKIATVYSELRRESAISHGMPIAVRHMLQMSLCPVDVPVDVSGPALVTRHGQHEPRHAHRGASRVTDVADASGPG